MLTQNPARMRSRNGMSASRCRRMWNKRFLHDSTLPIHSFSEEEVDEYGCEFVGTGKWLANLGGRLPRVYG